MSADPALTIASCCDEARRTRSPMSAGLLSGRRADEVRSGVPEVGAHAGADAGAVHAHEVGDLVDDV